MTNNIGDLLGDRADLIVQRNIEVGDVHLLNLDKSNGITPKNGEAARDKFFIVLGFDEEGNVIGGLVINSNINYNLPPSVTDYMLPVTRVQMPFLEHNSFVNCSKIITAKRSKFSKTTYRGEVSDKGMIELIINTVKESPTVSQKLLKEFGII